MGMKKYYIIVFDPRQQDWDEFRQNGKIVYFKSEKEAQKFGDAQRSGVNGRIFRQGDWQVISEVKQTMKMTKSKLKDIIREELRNITSEDRKVSYFGYKPDQIYYTPHIMDSGKFTLWKVMTFDDSPPFSTYKLPGGKKQDFKFFKDVPRLPRGAVSIRP